MLDIEAEREGERERERERERTSTREMIRNQWGVIHLSRSCAIVTFHLSHSSHSLSLFSFFQLHLSLSESPSCLNLSSFLSLSISKVTNEAVINLSRSCVFVT